jgi:hypothetical protein
MTFRSLHLALGLCLGVAAHSAAALPTLCPLPKQAAAFYVTETPATVCPKELYENDPVYAIAECSNTVGSVTCEAWPQVYVLNPGDGERLLYQWRVTSGHVTTVYPQSSNPVLSFHCAPLQTVFAQVTVRNGSATDTDSVGFRCGDDPE